MSGKLLLTMSTILCKCRCRDCLHLALHGGTFLLWAPIHLPTPPGGVFTGPSPAVERTLVPCAAAAACQAGGVTPPGFPPRSVIPAVLGCSPGDLRSEGTWEGALRDARVCRARTGNWVHWLDARFTTLLSSSSTLMPPRACLLKPPCAAPFCRAPVDFLPTL